MAKRAMVASTTAVTASPLSFLCAEGTGGVTEVWDWVEVEEAVGAEHAEEGELILVKRVWTACGYVKPRKAADRTDRKGELERG